MSRADALDRLTWAELEATIDGILAALTQPPEYADAREAMLEGFREGMAAADAEAATINNHPTE